jgi:hypothetical protein
MFNSPGYKRNANQNYIKISSQPKLEWPYSRTISTTTAGEDVVKQEPLYTVSRNGN